MIDVVVITSALKLLENCAKIGDNLTDAQQLEIRVAIKASKRALKKEKVARKLFDGCSDTKLFGDNSFTGTDKIFSRDSDEKESKIYWKLRDEFNKA